MNSSQHRLVKKKLYSTILISFTAKQALVDWVGEEQRSHSLTEKNLKFAW